MKSNIQRFVLLGAAASFCGASANEDPTSAIKKVVTLLEDMKAQTEKQAIADKKAYDSYACWCKTAEGEKTQAVEDAQTKIEDLEAFVEEAAATKAQLTTEIGELAKDIAKDEESVQNANGLREKEHDEFAVNEQDGKDVLSALGQAIDTLEKVQLLQKNGHPMSSPQVKPLLLQLRHVVGGVKGRMGQFQDAMQRDLWDFMSAMPGGDSFLPRKGSALAQQKLLPWENEEEDASAGGAAAGAKSYNSGSGQILGLLGEMKDEFTRDLAKSQYTEHQALVAHHTMMSAKTAEIAAGTEQKEEKEVKLADITKKAADAAEDLEATKESLGADQAILVDLDKNCQKQDDEYSARTKARNNELVALGETLKILTGDEVRDLFAKTVSFVQTGSVGTGQGQGKGISSLEEAQSKAVDVAMKRIVSIARKHHDWSFASLAIRIRLDPFTKINAVLDKMVAGLKKQQKEEYEKKDWCDGEIDSMEDSLKVSNQKREDLEETKLDVENGITVGSTDIDSLKTEISEMQVSLKKAGLDRKEENQVFQSSLADQRATIMILNKAMERLSQFYSKKSFAQVQQTSSTVAKLEPPPPTPQDYSKSGGGGGAIQLIQKIISDAEKAESEILLDEQAAQTSYSQFAGDTGATIGANQALITEKSQLLEENKATRSQTKESMMYNDEAIAKMEDSLHATHTECDFVIKYFSIRQQARKDEIAGIVEARAILSGAGLGQAMEAADDATA